MPEDASQALDLPCHMHRVLHRNDTIAIQVVHGERQRRPLLTLLPNVAEKAIERHDPSVQADLATMVRIHNVEEAAGKHVAWKSKELLRCCSHRLAPQSPVWVAESLEAPDVPPSVLLAAMWHSLHILQLRSVPQQHAGVQRLACGAAGTGSGAGSGAPRRGGRGGRGGVAGRGGSARHDDLHPQFRHEAFTSVRQLQLAVETKRVQSPTRQRDMAEALVVGSGTGILVEDGELQCITFGVFQFSPLVPDRIQCLRYGIGLELQVWFPRNLHHTIWIRFAATIRAPESTC
mmetsp:Transcript_9590/g.23889  ORF Transcript_9590/g.23889 Transcript_9590/m.23889 type:complete len:290 (-) Transcript_9590:2192-3061(-)